MAAEENIMGLTSLVYLVSVSLASNNTGAILSFTVVRLIHKYKSDFVVMGARLCRFLKVQLF